MASSNERKANRERQKYMTPGEVVTEINQLGEARAPESAPFLATNGISPTVIAVPQEDADTNLYITAAVALDVTGAITGVITPTPTPAQRDRQYLNTIGDGISTLAERLVYLTRVDRLTSSAPLGDLPILVSQVCPACREWHVFTTTDLERQRLEDPGATPDENMRIATIQRIGTEARVKRMTHRCWPIAPCKLDALTEAELEGLAEELERDGTNQIERSADIKTHLAARIAAKNLAPK